MDIDGLKLNKLDYFNAVPAKITKKPLLWLVLLDEICLISLS